MKLDDVKISEAIVKSYMKKLLSVLKSDVFNGGFDQWILNHRLDVDTDLRNVIQNVLGHWKSTVRTSVLPSLVVDLVRCALSWYDDQTTDRDTELDALDQKFYDLAGEDAVNYNADVETYLFLLGQSQGTAEEKIDRPA